MVRLSQLPTNDIIDGLAGTVDFYLLHPNPESEKSIPIARTWPRYVPGNYPASAFVMNPYFGYIGKMWPHIDATVQRAYKDLAESSSMAPRDYMVRAYINYKTM